MRGIAFYLTFVTLLLPTLGRPERVSPVDAAPTLFLLLISKIRLQLREKSKTLHKVHRVRFQFLNNVKRPDSQSSGDPSDLVDIFRIWDWR